MLSTGKFIIIKEIGEMRTRVKMCSHFVVLSVFRSREHCPFRSWKECPASSSRIGIFDKSKYNQEIIYPVLYNMYRVVEAR